MTQKEIAISCMEKLDIYKPYIRKFKSKAGIPCFFENFAGFWADQEEKLWTKIKEVEQEFNVLVYAITHERVDGQSMWSMLCISQNPDSIDDFLFDFGQPRHFYAYAYTWNEDVEYFSEFGDVVVKSFGGGIRRVV